MTNHWLEWEKTGEKLDTEVRESVHQRYRRYINSKRRADPVAKFSPAPDEPRSCLCIWAHGTRYLSSSDDRPQSVMAQALRQ
jgi:hypothetical protein